jgi:hypothetical protein
VPDRTECTRVLFKAGDTEEDTSQEKKRPRKKIKRGEKAGDEPSSNDTEEDILVEVNRFASVLSSTLEVK